MQSYWNCAKRRESFKKAMTKLNRKRWFDFNRWEKDIIYDIIGTLLLGAVIVALMML